MKAGVARRGGPSADGTEVDGSRGQIAPSVRPCGANIYVRVHGR
jgi:hypothetical protein